LAESFGATILCHEIVLTAKANFFFADRADPRPQSREEHRFEPQ
jgi:hypothetical protein